LPQAITFPIYFKDAKFWSPPGHQISWPGIVWWFSSVQLTCRFKTINASFHKCHPLMRRYVFWFHCRNLWTKYK
jgi:hypothetical protein